MMLALKLSPPYEELRSASSPLAVRAASVVHDALLDVLPGPLGRCLTAGGSAGLGILARRLKVAAFNPEQARDEDGKWTAVTDLRVYHGGVKTHSAAVTYYTTNREMAESYVAMSNDRFGSGGAVHEARITLKNPAPAAIIEREAQKLGIDNSLYTPASVFDAELHGEQEVRQLVRRLGQLEYDGAVLSDIAYGKQIEDQAYVVFRKARAAAFNPDEPRDEHGQWSTIQHDFQTHDPEPGFVYHATNVERAQDIASSALQTHGPSYGTEQSAWPDGSTERRSYWTAGGGRVATSFAPENGKPVLLRTRQDVRFKRESTGDIYTKKTIAASDLEMLHADGWKALHLTTASFDEASHPRDEKGQFAVSRGWHLTDNPNFVPDPTQRPEMNSLGGDLWGKENWPQGLMVGDPEYWMHAHGYERPYVAEIEGRVTNPAGTIMHRGKEQFMQGEMKTVRVLPLDEYARETFGGTGWVEEYFGDAPNKIPQNYVGRPVSGMSADEIKQWEKRFEEYVNRTDGPRARTRNAELRTARDYVRDNLGQFAEAPGDGTGGGSGLVLNDKGQTTGPEWHRSPTGANPYGWLPPSGDAYTVPTITHHIVEDRGMWGNSHGNSSRLTGESAVQMGIPGYTKYEVTPEAERIATKFLTGIANDQGSEEVLHHSFENVRQTQFQVGDTLRLPLTATSGNVGSYGKRSASEDQQGQPVVLEFEPGTQMVAYSGMSKKDAVDLGHPRTEQGKLAAIKERGYVWDEAIVAGGFRIESVRTEYMGSQHSNTPRQNHETVQIYGKVVRLKQVETFDLKTGWRARG